MSWKFVAALRGPACLVQNRNVGNTLSSLDHIPGSTLRGLLAQLYLEEHNTTMDDQFRELFLNEAVSYPDLTPRGARVIPLSALSCKYHPGFERDREVRGHGVVDAVLPCLRHFRSHSAGIESPLTPCGFSSCRAPLERFSGYYEGTVEGERQVTVNRRLLARTAILEGREVAKPAHLYTLDVLAEGQEFTGDLIAGDSQVTLLQSLLASRPEGWIGTARSRGLGEVELSLIPDDDGPRASLSQRIEGFNRALGPDGRISSFSITLESDAIVLDELLGYRGRPEISDLREAIGMSTDAAVVERFELIAAWADAHRITGWQAAWGLPKPDEQAIRRGSVFVYGLKDNNSALSDPERHQLVAALSSLERNGLGERPGEGFGRLRICDEFHWENELK